MWLYLYLCCLVFFLYLSCIYFVSILYLYCTSAGNWELLLMVGARAVRRWCDCHALTSPSRVWSPGRPPKTKLTLFFYFTFDLFINVVKVFCGKIILKWLSQVGPTCVEFVEFVVFIGICTDFLAWEALEFNPKCPWMICICFIPYFCVRDLNLYLYQYLYTYQLLQF